MSTPTFETPPCKLKRLGADNKVFLVIEKDPVKQSFFNFSSDLAVEYAPDKIQCSPTNEKRCWQISTGDHVFSAFSLVPDGTGVWQLRFVLVPPPGMTQELLETSLAIPGAKRQEDLVLGELPFEGGRAGLVPRLTDGKPTVGSQIVLHRNSCAQYANVTISNSVSGTLYYDESAQGYFFGTPPTPDCFQFHRILSMLDMSMTETLEFVRSPDNPSILMLPPADVSAADFEATHFPSGWNAASPGQEPPLNQEPDPYAKSNEGNSSSVGGSHIGEKPANSAAAPVAVAAIPPTKVEELKKNEPVSAWLIVLIAGVGLLGGLIALALRHRQKKKKRVREAAIFSEMQ